MVGLLLWYGFYGRPYGTITQTICCSYADDTLMSLSPYAAVIQMICSFHAVHLALCHALHWCYAMLHAGDTLCSTLCLYLASKAGVWGRSPQQAEVEWRR